MRILMIIIFFIASSLSLFLHAAVVRIGTPFFQPPYVINMKNNPVQGFDIAIMDIICKRMNWQCEFIPILYNDFFTALNNNTIDYAIGGIVINPVHQEGYLFSLPYLPSQAGFLTLVNSNFKTLNDLQNKRIGSLQGTIYTDYLANQFPIPVNAVDYKLYGDLIMAMKNEEIDAIFLNYDTALYFEHQYPSIVQVLPYHMNLGYGMGILTTDNHAAEIEQINKIILQNEADGTFVKLYNYYFAFFINSTTKENKLTP